MKNETIAPEIETDRFLLERIVGVAMPDNIGSWRVLEHLGFIFEREAHLYDLDVLVYAIKREQFGPGDAFFHVNA